MSGLNQNLAKSEKVQCLFCLSTEEPNIKSDRVFCSSCGSTIQAYIDMPLTSIEVPTIEISVD